MSYIAFLDLLGITASTTETSLYESKIRGFTVELINASGLLGKDGKLRYFSDCAYVQAGDLGRLINFLTHLRDNLLLEGTYLSAAVIKGVLAPRESRIDDDRICDVHGVSFFGKDIAKLFLFHNEFKGAGIRLDKDVADELSALGSSTVVDSFFIPEISQSGEKEKITFYKDVAFWEKYTNNTFNNMFIKVLQDALLAGSQNSRFGRNYIPLMVNFMRSRPEASFCWKKAESEEETTLECESYPCQMIYRLSFKWGKVPDLFGLHYLSLVLLGMLYEDYPNNYLTDVDRTEVSLLLLQKGILSEKYDQLNKLPAEDFFDKTIAEQIRNDYLQSVAKEVINL